MVPASDPEAIEWLLTVLSTETPTGHLSRLVATVANEVGALLHAYPTYIAVCRTTPAGTTDGPARVCRRGANRTLVFEIEDGDVVSVRKLPNHPAHGAYNERAAAVLSTLRSRSTDVTATLPSVSLERTRCGPVIVEGPASATPLRDAVEGARPSPETFERVLRLGLEWIRSFQEAYTGPRTTRSAAAVRRDLAVDPLGLEPPAVTDPVSFPTVPVHGDYHPGNVMQAADGSIDRIIDWEYASLTGDPIADPGLYALSLATFSFGGFEAGLRQAFLEDTPYSSILYDRLAAYGDSIGVSPRTFAIYLGSAYARQATVHFDVNGPWRFHLTPREKADRLAVLYDERPEICRRLAAASADARRESSGPAVRM
ncbi:hypothetical protein CP557_00485 [Natrinema ejinorense]|uniref:Aminoglycoside phosphotransferase domain-containing protein n=2 Tax=Natrinema ejinorense TaxID=373386 RepID=A0A2A5R0D6_9EURY|nr:hypothetical protein CP557_00485 [Natrinema ejinorense]